jgi:hypothetical protein
VVSHEVIQDAQQVAALTGADPVGVQMFRLILAVSANPPYTNAYDFFEFDPDNEDEGED